MIRVTLFTQQDCTRCDEIRNKLNDLQQEIPHQLVEIDIAEDPLLQREYAGSVPVVQAGPYTLEGDFSERHLHVTLAAARDRGLQQATPSGAPSRFMVRFNRFARSLARHWLGIFNGALFLYVSLPFLAAVFMHAGLNTPARAIYRIYSPLCHQLAYRSWFLFGEQAYYPLENAGLDVVTYEEVSGLEADDLYGARAFIGDEQVGFKVALCQRDVAIYASMLAAGLVFALFRDRIKPLPLFLWLLLGIMPMALDGGTQLLSSLPWFSFPLRESTPFLRILTGSLFGLANIWMAYPYLQESMQEVNLIATTNILTVDKVESARDT